jgi:hypothetical protein
MHTRVLFKRRSISISPPKMRQNMSLLDRPQPPNPRRQLILHELISRNTAIQRSIVDYLDRRHSHH